MLGEIQNWLHIDEHFDAEQTDFKTDISGLISRHYFTFYAKLATCKTYFSFYCFNKPFNSLTYIDINIDRNRDVCNVKYPEQEWLTIFG